MAPPRRSLGILLVVILSWIGSATEFRVSNYGAIGNGIVYDTDAIQAAIDACYEAGGGDVVFDSGFSYLSGTIFLKSGVYLNLESNSTILGGTQRSDYPEHRAQWYVIWAQDVVNAGLRGEGTVDGQAEQFVVSRNPQKYVMRSWVGEDGCTGEECRPRLVGFQNGINVTLEGVHLRQSADWTLVLYNCTDTSVSGVSIYGDNMIPNNDGIDIYGGNNVHIHDVDIDTGDDAICPKSGTGQTLSNLLVERVSIRTKSSAIKLGSTTAGNFSRLIFRDIVIRDSHRGVGVQLRDGGFVDDVLFHNISITTRLYDESWWGRAEPIYISAFPRDTTTELGYISNVVLSDITALSENGAFVSGGEGDAGVWGANRVRGLTMSNVHVEVAHWTEYAGGQHDYRPSNVRGLIEHPTSALFLEYASDVKISDCSFGLATSKGDAWEPFYGLTLDSTPGSVRGLVMEGVEFDAGAADSTFSSAILL